MVNIVRKYNNTVLAGFCISFLFTVVFSQNNNHVSLRISEQVKLIGTQEKTSEQNGRTYYGFMGIPYAEPPVNQNRWMEPKLLDLTKPEYDTTNYGERCIQWYPDKMIGSEDCLFLNVFTPKLNEQGVEVDGTKDQLLFPVMVYIHGGGYILGSSNGIGPRLFMKHDIVLVTFNYRLGVLGYLSTGNKNLPGNYGALDQVVALDWVQKYIHKFGGDPKNVTIFGHSAGGGAVHMLTMSPRTLGKYHKAIIQSGSALNDWGVDKNPKIYAKDFAGRLGCQYEITSPQLINCLKKKTTSELLIAQRETIDYWVVPVTSRHVVDSETRGSNAFLLDYPELLMDQGLYHSTPVLTGVTSVEGLMPYTFFHLEVGDFQDLNYFHNKIIPKIVKSFLPFGQSEVDVARITAAVIKEYFPENKSIEDCDKITGVTEIYGDCAFYNGQLNMLQKYAYHDINPVYSYVFTYRTAKSPSMIWKQIEELRERNVNHDMFDSAASHVDDMYYFFEPCEQGRSNPNHTMSQEDREFADYLTEIWVAFAKSGNPNKGVSTKKGFYDWKPLSGSVNYYNLTSIPAPMGELFREKESTFWKRVYHSLDPNKRIADEL